MRSKDTNSDTFLCLPVRHLTEHEAAELTGYSRSWFQRKRWEGGGPPFRKIGSTIRYPADELANWLNSHGLHCTTYIEANRLSREDG